MHRTRRRGLALAIALATTLLATLAAPAAPAEAAGVTTHSWMALEAIDEVSVPQLKALLQANRDEVRAGAHFPDTGYVPGNQYGEEAHWQRYADAYAAEIAERTDCGDLTNPTGPCAPAIAHLMGTVAHGMGDEVWDWLFEPNSPDLDEYYLPADFGDYASPGGQELQMDLVAIADFGQPTTPLAPIPSRTNVLDAFGRVSFIRVSNDQLTVGQIGMDVVHSAEGFWAPRHIDALRQEMPWMSHNLVTAPGGVHFAAVAIAGYWESMWGRMLGDQPDTRVSITYPADGQRRIPATGWNRANYIAGSNPGSGGARTRITAALTYSRPYLELATTGGSIPRTLPAGSMTLTERDAATPVASRSGFPSSQPYGADAGHHLVDFQPAADLAPCTWYRVDVTANLLDANGDGVTPASWEFRTGQGSNGARCPDDPYTPDEAFARKVTADLLDRSRTDQETADDTYRFERGLGRRTLTAEVLDGQEHRELLVTEGFDRYLDRLVDPSGLAYWSAKLEAITLPDFYARLLGSPEVYREAGGTNRAYVAALYPLVHGREVDPSGLDYWTRRLDAGLGRGTLAKSLLTSRESARRTVVATYQEFLGRDPDGAGLDFWTGRLQRGGSPRAIWEAIIASSEYDRLAQASCSAPGTC